MNAAELAEFEADSRAEASDRPNPMPQLSMRGGRGRPTRCTPEVTSAICAIVAEGVAFKTACAAEGISEVTGHEWMRLGEAGKEPYAIFFAAVTRARARGEIGLHRQVREGGKGSAGAAFVLERRFREHYGRVERVEHAGHDGGPLAVEADLRTAESVRKNGKASSAMHDALALAVEAAKE